MKIVLKKQKLNTNPQSTPRSQEILMFVSKNIPNNVVTPQSLTVLTSLVHDYWSLTSAMSITKLYGITALSPFLSFTSTRITIKLCGIAAMLRVFLKTKQYTDLQKFGNASTLILRMFPNFRKAVYIQTSSDIKAHFSGILNPTNEVMQSKQVNYSFQKPLF